MTMQAVGIDVNIIDAAVTTPLVPEETIVGIAGDISGGTATTAFTLNTPTLVSNKAAWDAIGATGGEAYRAIEAIYARGVNPRIIVSRGVARDNTSGSLNPTSAESIAAINGLGDSRSVLGIEPDIIAAPNQTWNRTGAGVPVTPPTASTVVTQLQTTASALSAVAVVDMTPGTGTNANKVSEMVTNLGQNRGDRIIALCGRNAVDSSDVRSIVGNYIAELVYLDGTPLGRHTNPNYRPVTGVTMLDPIIAYGRDTDAAGRITAAGGTTLIRDTSGWHIWGNVFNTTETGGTRFVNILRMRDLVIRNMQTIGRGLLLHNATDLFFDIANRHYNNYFRALATPIPGFGVGQITYGVCSTHPTKNTPEALANGRTFFRVVLGFAAGLYRIEFDVEV